MIVSKQHSRQYFILTTLLVSLSLVLAGRYFVSAPMHKYADVLFLFTSIAIASIISVFKRDFTQSKIVYDDMSIRREYLRETLNSVSEAFIINDLNGIVDDLNKSAEAITGWKKNNVLGKPLESIFRIYDPETGQRIENIIQQILNNNSAIETERNLILKNSKGERIFITCVGSPIKDSSGIILGTVLTFRNISDRKKLESENKEMTNRLLLATKSAELGIWSWDLKNDVLTWDDKIDELYQVNKTMTSASISQWLDYVHPDDREKVKGEINQALAELKPYSAEFRILTNNNSVRYLRASGVLEKDENGNSIKMIGVNWDVTKEKLNEETVLKSEAFSRGVLNSLSSEIAVIDHTGTILKVSESWNKFATDNGISNTKSVGEGVNYLEVCRKSVESGDRLAQVVLNGIENVIYGRKLEFYAEYPCHAKFEKRWFSLNVTRFGGNNSLFVIEHQNITSRMLAEMQRERSTQDLLQRNKNMEQFSFIVSHNLRGPVASILGFAELMKDENTMQKSGTDIMKGMALAALKLDEIIKDLNIILQTKNQTLVNSHKVSFGELMKDVSRHLTSLSNEKSVVIKSDFSAADSILSDRQYLSSILLHLINNCIQFRNENVPLQIEVSSARVENFVQLRIKDNGLGMDLERNGEKLFGLYSRFHDHIQSKGMGLFMVKTQVEKLGGKITAKSELDKGTEFLIEFENALVEKDA